MEHLFYQPNRIFCAAEHVVEKRLSPALLHFVVTFYAKGVDRTCLPVSCWQRTLAHLLPSCARSDAIRQCRSAKTKLEKILFALPRECAIWAPRPQDNIELKDRTRSFGKQVEMQQSVCESRQAVAEGDRLLTQQLKASKVYICCWHASGGWVTIAKAGRGVRGWRQHRARYAHVVFPRLGEAMKVKKYSAIRGSTVRRLFTAKLSYNLLSNNAR